MLSSVKGSIINSDCWHFYRLRFYNSKCFGLQSQHFIIAAPANILQFVYGSIHILCCLTEKCF